MLFSRWLRRSHPRATTYQPSICELEDRIVPAGFRFLGSPVHPPAPATHLVLIVPPNVQEGKAVNVIVEAMDAGNHVVTGFKGTVQISLGSADALATLPASF